MLGLKAVSEREQSEPPKVKKNFVLLNLRIHRSPLHFDSHRISVRTIIFVYGSTIFSLGDAFIYQGLGTNAPNLSSFIVVVFQYDQ